MSAIKTNSALDAEMLAKVKPGWWIFDGDDWHMVRHWCHDEDDVRLRYPFPFFNDGADAADCADAYAEDRITAIHAPTDATHMETAYLLGQPDTVTREEAHTMADKQPGWKWFGTMLPPPDEPAWNPVLWTNNIDSALAIRSPGGNVYKIEGGAK